MDPYVSFVVPIADVFYAFRESSLPGKAIVLLLFVGSIAAWSIMITKGLQLRRAVAQTHDFLKSFRLQRHPIALFLQGVGFEGSPVCAVYRAACKGLGEELDLPTGAGGDRFGGGAPSTDRLTKRQISAIAGLADRTVAEEALQLERHMNLLATAVSAAPFLGLLGTVWGVMDGFGGMAREGAATLSAVAPGISAALLTTVVGLLVALPSAIGYNLLTNQIRWLTVQMDNFADELNTALQRHYALDRGD